LEELWLDQEVRMMTELRMMIRIRRRMKTRSQRENGYLQWLAECWGELEWCKVE
jgi:hypothetical protein